MDDSSTKLLPKKLQPLPPNRILPKLTDYDIANYKGALKSE